MSFSPFDLPPAAPAPADDKPVDFWVIVALDDDCEYAWILEKSEDCRAVDLIEEVEASDNGIDMTWSKGREMGIYKLTLKPWSYDDDCGCDVTNVETIFERKA